MIGQPATRELIYRLVDLSIRHTMLVDTPGPKELTLEDRCRVAALAKEISDMSLAVGRALVSEAGGARGRRRRERAVTCGKNHIPDYSGFGKRLAPAPRGQGDEVMKRIKVLIDNREHELPRACRAAHVLAVRSLDGTYRIFRDRGGLLCESLHPAEFIFPEEGDQFACVPRATGGPGGGDDHRYRMIAASIASDDGDADAWTRFEEWERDQS